MKSHMIEAVWNVLPDECRYSGYVSTWEYMIRMNWQNILRSLTIHIMHWQKEQITIINIDYTIVSIIEYCAKN